MKISLLHAPWAQKMQLYLQTCSNTCCTPFQSHSVTFLHCWTNNYLFYTARKGSRSKSKGGKNVKEFERETADNGKPEASEFMGIFPQFLFKNYYKRTIDLSNIRRMYQMGRLIFLVGNGDCASITQPASCTRWHKLPKSGKLFPSLFIYYSAVKMQTCPATFRN